MENDIENVSFETKLALSETKSDNKLYDDKIAANVEPQFNSTTLESAVIPYQEPLGINATDSYPVLERKEQKLKVIHKSESVPISLATTNTVKCLTIKDGTYLADAVQLLLSDTRALRDVVYGNWSHQKTAEVKFRNKEALLLKKMEMELKEKEEKKKIQDGLTAFHVWTSKKSELREKILSEMKKNKEQKKQEAEKKEQEKQEDASVAYKYWKEKKETLMKELLEVYHREKHMKRQLEDDEKWKRQNECLVNLQKWKEEKEDMEKNKIENALKEEYHREILLQEKMKRDRKALKAYHKWLQEKEIEQEKSKIGTRDHSRMRPSSPIRPPWSPPGLNA